MGNIFIYSDREIGALRKSAEITGKIIDKIRSIVKPGISTQDIDDYAAALMKEYRVKSAFLGYQGFPASVCTSVDSEVVHGIPDAKRILRNGQILSVDLGIVKDGFYGDMALTIPVGEIDERKRKLLDTTKNALESAISFCIEGNRLGDVSSAVQVCAESAGYSVVRDFVGHGIGRKLHEEPQIPNFGQKQTGVRLQKGMVFALEPMLNAGGHRVKVLDDGWTVVTEDSEPSAHFEKMVSVGKNEPVLLSSIVY